MAAHHSSNSSRVSGCTSSTSIDRELLDATVRKAELECQMQSLRRKHELDKIEEEIQWKKRMLEIETQLAMFNAKIEVLDGEDGLSSKTSRSSRRSHKRKVERWIKENEQCQEQLLTEGASVARTPIWDTQADMHNTQYGSQFEKIPDRMTKVDDAHAQSPPLVTEGASVTRTPIWDTQADMHNTQYGSQFEKIPDRMTKVDDAHAQSPPLVTEGASVTRTPIWDTQADMHNTQYGSQFEKIPDRMTKVDDAHAQSPPLVTEGASVTRTPIWDTQADMHNTQYGSQFEKIPDRMTKVDDAHVQSPPLVTEGASVMRTPIWDTQADMHNTQYGSQFERPPIWDTQADMHKYYTDQQGLQSAQNSSLISELTGMLRLQQLRATLPHRTITPYNGDPLKFCTFMKSFEYGIERKCTDNMEKLYFLEEFTTGEPNILVRGFLDKNKVSTFDDAKAALKKKFGNRHIIAEVFKDKANKWPEIKKDDVKGWTSFSIFLGEFWQTMENLEYASDVDQSVLIKNLVSKLPYSVRNLWRVHADKVMEEIGRMVRFRDFMEFIDKQVRIVSNPVYGNIVNINDPVKDVSRSRQRMKQPARSPLKSSSFNTATKEAGSDSSNYCLFCDKNTHPLEMCRVLQKKPHADRIAYMRGKGLCYGCLKKGTHLCKDCTKRLQCSKCTGKHPTVLHQERRNEQSKKEDRNYSHDSKQKDTNQEAVNSVSCRLTGAGETTTQTVLPVLVQSTETGEIIQVNAMLDDGSNATFCTEKLKQKLKHKAGVKTKLHISTITGDEIVNTCKIKGLQLMDVSKECTIDLPEVYTRTSIPANGDDYPTMEDLKKWPHLRAVHLPEIQGEVDLLIGNNVPKALEPWQIIHSNHDGPFASKTLLGWTVHGLTKPALNDSSVVVNRIMVVEDIDKQLTKLYNTDFVERIIEDTSQRSVEDEKFMAKVKKSVRVEDGH